MKASTKGALLSALTIATLLSSSIAMAGLTPGQIEDENNRRGQPQQQGLTPAQIEAQNQQEQDLAAARERERIARDRQAEIDARAFREREAARREFERIQEEQRQERIREEFRRQVREQEFRRQQQEAQNRANAIAAEQMRLADEARRQQQEAQDRANANAAEQIRLADEARRLQEERDALARQGSASIAFTGVTQKKEGEWLRVSLRQPMQLSSVEIAVLEAKAKIHEVIVHADNGQSFELQANGSIIFSTQSAAQIKDLRASGIVNRITAIDLRVESMRAKSVISVKVNSPEGTPTLAKRKFAAKK